MARAAVIADRSMYRFGLSGRSFLPLLSAYACAVPADHGHAHHLFAPRPPDHDSGRAVHDLLRAVAAVHHDYRGVHPGSPVVGPVPRPARLRDAGPLLHRDGCRVDYLALLHLSLLRKDDSAFAIELPEFRLPLWRSLGINLRIARASSSNRWAP